MTQSSEYAVQVLSDLLMTTLDSADGYEKAAELARNPRFKILFEQRAESRHQLTRTLKDEVRALDGEPPANGSMLGLAHRTFLGLRDKIGGGSDRSVIDELERGETFIRDKFEQAAHDEALPPGAREVADRMHGAISADCDEIAALRDQFS